jgi:hypothetical protein
MLSVCSALLADDAIKKVACATKASNHFLPFNSIKQAASFWLAQSEWQTRVPPKHTKVNEPCHVP